MALRDWFRRSLGRSGRGPDVEMITCEEAFAVVYEYLDGELDPGSYERVRAHFEVCAECYPMLRMEEAFRAAVRRAGRGQAAPPELRHSLLEALTAIDGR